MAEERALEAADGLQLVPETPGTWRLAWGEPDWLGPLCLSVSGGGPEAVAARPTRGEDDLGVWQGLALDGPGLAVAASVRAYTGRPVLVFRLEALEEIEGLATGTLARPSVSWPWLRPALRREGGVPEGTRGYGHQYTEFAFPTFSDASLGNFFLFPHRPPVVSPLWLNAPDGRSLLLAPMGDFHDQVISVEDGVRCGWHGDLASVPQGFATEVALWAGHGPRGVLEQWASALRRRHATERPSRYADATVGRLSYWTDNGSAYWYRTEPGMDLLETLGAVADGFADQRIPVSAWELDSWFYPHEKSRQVGPEGPAQVPPTGAMLWEPRDDVLPDGIEALRERIGRPPLILHARHYSSRSPYFETASAWLDGDRGHPRDPDFFEGLVARAATWGAITIEQDWLVEMVLGVRGLRERPGRIREWQERFDRAAAEHGLSLLWCMATPADFLQTLTLKRVVSIRTSGDYRYLTDNPALWPRFLYTNALARALGLLPFKDVFLSNAAGEGLDGDPHAEAEALLSALSTGPVGLGDRAGRTDRALVLRTCREDGLLVKPDVPIAAIDRCLRADCFFEPEPLVGECWTDHPAGRWSYVACFHASRERRPLDLALPLAELGEAAPAGPSVLWDWRARTAHPVDRGDVLAETLAPGDWRLFVLCPVLAGGIALFGDVERYASAGDRRLHGVRVDGDAVELEVRGSPGERVELTGWCDGEVFRRPVAIGRSGRCPLRLTRSSIAADRISRG